MSLPPLRVLSFLELASQKALKWFTGLLGEASKKKKVFFLKLHCHSLYFFFFNLITCDAFLGAVRIQTDKTKRRRIVLQMEISVLLHWKLSVQLHRYSWTFLDMACFGAINDCELFIKELTALGDSRPARIHALWREKEKHPRVPGAESPSWLDPGPSGHPVTPDVFPRQQLLGPVGTWLLPATIPCTAPSTLIGGGSSPLPLCFNVSVQRVTANARARF